MITNFLKHLSSSEILKKISISFILKVFGTISAFIMYIVISRLYGAEGMGLFSLFIAIIGLAGILSTAGMTSSMMRFVPEFIANEKLNELYKLRFIHFIISGTLSVSLMIALLLLTDEIAINIFHNSNNTWMIKIVSITLPFYSLYLIGNEFIRAIGHIALYEYLRSLHIQFVGLIILVTLSFFYETIYLPVIITAFLYMLACFIVWTVVRHFLKSHKANLSSAKITFRKTIKVSFPMLLTSFSALIMERIDTLMIGFFYGNEEIGIYNIALKLSVLILFLIIPVNAVLIPKISQAFWQQETDQLKILIHKTSKYMFYSSTMVFVCLIVFSEYFLGLFGKEFITGKYAIIFLSVGYLINAIHGLAEHLLNISGNEKKLTVIFTIGLIVNIILNYILIPIYGINGAAFATMTSMIFWNILAGLSVNTHIGFSIVYIPFCCKSDKY